MDAHVKQDTLESFKVMEPKIRNEEKVIEPALVIEIGSSSESESDSDDLDDFDWEELNAAYGSGEGRPYMALGDGFVKKKRKYGESDGVLPVGFLSSLPPPVEPIHLPAKPVCIPEKNDVMAEKQKLAVSCKQFWKAGDYEGGAAGDWDSFSGGLDHVRVHPKFLHSNATSHKWAIGAFAELLDNSLDEVCNGATYVNIDVVKSKKDKSRMLLIEDNGGGMDPEKMRHCMSLGYSAKNKIANTIGQYGNGFKTSTMRLGADVIVFSRYCGKNGKRSTQSIGLLSYTFLKKTRKEDIVVPMLDYESREHGWDKLIRSSCDDWNKNMETIVRWSPFSSEAVILRQFDGMKDQGTRIVIYNLWENDEEMLELDFDTDLHDIQLRGVNRDEKNIEMARKYPNSRHFLTYRHSLRIYASILYLRLPPCFRIILRGEDVEHHNIVNDMMMSERVTYRPHAGPDGILRNKNMCADVTVGFVKDAKHHIDVQGFNVYHKNRLIKPFWRIWNSAGSQGRGVIGVLEANFVEPAHDKQGFERTTALARLEARLVQMQRDYWLSKCHDVGYAACRSKQKTIEPGEGTSFGYHQSPSEKTSAPVSSGKHLTRSFEKQMQHVRQGTESLSSGRSVGPVTRLRSKGSEPPLLDSGFHTLKQFKQGNNEQTERLEPIGGELMQELQQKLLCEKNRCKSLESELELANKQYDELNEEQENLIDLFTKERDRHDEAEEKLTKQLEDASNTIQELHEKVKRIEKMKTITREPDH